MSGPVVLAIIERDKKILLVRERDKIHFKLPGGHVSDFENDYQALARELKEELGVEVKHADYLSSAKSNNHDIKLYNVQIAGEPCPMGEIEKVLWVDHDLAKKEKYILTAEALTAEKQDI